MLDAAKIKYEVLTYEVDESDLSGVHIGEQLGLPFGMLFKTLVAKGDKTGFIVFCLPVDKEVDLRRAAALTGNKKIEMLHVKDLLTVTGYIRGGCSPIGMKKKFPTFFDESVLLWEKITVSAGVRGAQLLLMREDVIKYIGAQIISLANG